VHKETSAALRIIDIARCRGYDMSFLLTHELTTTSLFLTRDGFLTKTVKSDLVHELENKLEQPPILILPESVGFTATVIDFMAFARRVPVKTAKLKNFQEFAECVWKTIHGAAGVSERIDIIFDNYYDRSIKGFERSRRSKKVPVEFGYPQGYTPLPIDMEAYWASSQNKMQLESFFIDWMTQNAVSLTGTLTIFLGGGHKTDPKRCLVICNGNIKEEALLQCNLEEADDRMLFHVSHMVSSEAKRVVICSTDTDVFVNALYHFHDTWQKMVYKNYGLYSVLGKVHDLFHYTCSLTRTY
jgi:hypothetical protein